MKKHLTLLVGLIVLATCRNTPAFTNVPPPINSYKAVFFGSTNSLYSGWAARFTNQSVPYSTNYWTCAFSGNGGWGYTGDFDTNFIDRCLASNVWMVLMPSQNEWQAYNPYGFQFWNTNNAADLAMRYGTAAGLLILAHHGFNYWALFPWDEAPPAAFEDPDWNTAATGPVAPILISGDAFLGDGDQGWNERRRNGGSWGRNVEFSDWGSGGGTNIVPDCAGRFVRVINYGIKHWNSFDVRGAARATCGWRSQYSSGPNIFYPNSWTNSVGYGYMQLFNQSSNPTTLDEEISPTALYVEPPLSTFATVSNDTTLYFFWENYLMGDWKETQIKHIEGGTNVYQGPGSNIVYSFYNGDNDTWYTRTLNGVKLTNMGYMTGSNSFRFKTKIDWGGGTGYSGDNDPWTKVWLHLPE